MKLTRLIRLRVHVDEAGEVSSSSMQRRDAIVVVGVQIEFLAGLRERQHSGEKTSEHWGICTVAWLHPALQRPASSGLTLYRSSRRILEA